MNDELRLARELAAKDCASPQHAGRETLLIADDMPENLLVLGELFRANGYQVKVANTGPAALRLARQAPRPSLIMLDVMMPAMDGFEVFRELQAAHETRDIPVVFLTANAEVEIEEAALGNGIIDFIRKPIRPSIVLARIRNHLLIDEARRYLLNKNAILEREVRQRELENEMIQDVCIRALAKLAETRDDDTGNHVRRTQRYVRLLAGYLSGTPRFSGILTEQYVDALVRSAPLHDIGKVGIPDQILMKSGPLSADERELMKTHTTLGCEAISSAERDIDASVAFLSKVKEIVRWHHERWDGAGYPDGLVGDAIPLCARIMAIADVFDALITKRVYKAALPLSEVKAIIAGERGRQFDPDIVDTFLLHWDAFKTIAIEGAAC